MDLPSDHQSANVDTIEAIVQRAENAISEEQVRTAAEDIYWVCLLRFTEGSYTYRSLSKPRAIAAACRIVDIYAEREMAPECWIQHLFRLLSGYDSRQRRDAPKINPHLRQVLAARDAEADLSQTERPTQYRMSKELGVDRKMIRQWRNEEDHSNRVDRWKARLQQA